MPYQIDATKLRTAEDRLAQTVATYTAAIEAHVEATAGQRQYTSAVSAASYVASTNPVWAAQAQAFVAWRDAVWMQALAILAAAQTGGPVPTLEEVIAALPPMQWPPEVDWPA